MKDLIMIASIIIFQLTLELQLRIYLSLMDEMKNIQLIISVVSLFTINSIVIHGVALFLILKPLLCPPPLFVFIILLQKQKLKREENTP